MLHRLCPVIYARLYIYSGKEAGEIRRGEEFRKAWAEVYGELSEGKPGLVGAMISRGEAQVMRLSVIYALLDGTVVLQKDHLKAALALWEYVEASVRYVFGNATGDPITDQIEDALRRSETGLTKTQIHGLFGRHKRMEEIDRALSYLGRVNK